MTREEEIKQEIDLRLAGCFGDYSEGYEEGFIEGAKWADKTMIEKACEWLDNINTDNYMDSGVFQMSDLIIDLKKQWKENNYETLDFSR